MKLFDYINENLFHEAIDLGYINQITHPKYSNIIMLNYTKPCQYNKYWNDTTKKCRGLIYDKYTENILAIPFKKFFNVEEYDNSIPELNISNIPINSTSIKIFNKLDGSLGILYWIEDKPYITTKGSFNSEQGAHATQILHSKYSHIIDKLDRNVTYLFEIIYPEDLHCITYKDVDDLFLIGVIDLSTGNSLDIYQYSNLFKCTEEYPEYSNNWKNIRNLISSKNKEGFVILFNNSFRLKLKYEEYWKLHFLKAGLSKSKILQHFINGNFYDIQNQIKLLDEEHIIYYQNIINDLHYQFKNILYECFSFILKYNLFELNQKDKKETALIVCKNKYKSIIFSILQQHKYDYIIWKYIKNYGN
jgi:RNA ligase